MDSECGRKVNFFVGSWHEVTRVDSFGTGDEICTVDRGFSFDEGLNGWSST